MKYAWIERHRHHWPVALACHTLGVSLSGYHEHMHAGQNSRSVNTHALLVHIRVYRQSSDSSFFFASSLAA